MNRRQFLKGLLSTTALAASPIHLRDAIEEANRSLVIENKTFYVRETLHIYDHGVTIRNCRFIAMPELGAAHLLHLHGDSVSVIENCSFEGIIGVTECAIIL